MDRGPQYAACGDLAARKAFESTTFADYLKAYHWSIPNTQEPVTGKVYEEPLDDDEAGKRVKEETIKKLREVCPFNPVVSSDLLTMHMY